MKKSTLFTVLAKWLIALSLIFLLPFYAWAQGNPSLPVLKVAGYLPLEIQEAIDKHIKNFQIVSDDLRFPTPDDTVSAMVTGASDVDLFVLSNQTDHIRRMIEKGYLHSLHESALLRSFQQGLRDNVKNFVSDDKGRLRVFPLSFGFDCWVERPNALKELGLRAPTDYLALCDFIDTWYADDAAAHSDYEPMPLMFYNERGLCWKAFSTYCEYRRASGEIFTFDTDIFRRLIKRCMQVNKARIEKMGGINTEALLESTDQENALKQMRTYLVCSGYHYMPTLEYIIANNLYTEKPLLMSVDSTVPAYPSGRISLLGINAHSPNTKQALAFLEELSKVLSDMTKLQLSNQVTEGIENPYYPEEIGYIEKSLASLKEQKEKTENELERRQMDEHIAEAEKGLAAARKNRRFLVDSESVALANKRYADVKIYDFSMLYEKNQNIRELFTRFLDGNLSLDLFIQQADSVLWLIDGERKR